MTKREIIDHIMEVNPSARPEFLADFSRESLAEYLDHLYEVRSEQRPSVFLEPAVA